MYTSTNELLGFFPFLFQHLPHVGVPHVNVPHVGVPHVNVPHVGVPHASCWCASCLMLVCLMLHVGVPHVGAAQVNGLCMVASLPGRPKRFSDKGVSVEHRALCCMLLVSEPPPTYILHDNTIFGLLCGGSCNRG